MALPILRGNACLGMVYPLAGEAVFGQGLANARALQIIYQALHAFGTGTVGAAIDRAVALDTMAKDPAAAAGTRWRQAVNRTFEGIESIGFIIDSNLEALVVGISALMATFHIVCFRTICATEVIL
jgi:hypothetical protein